MKSPDAATRERSIHRFLAAQQWGDADRQPLAQDASSRRYVRLRRGGERVLLMDAPPPEDPGAFLRITRHLDKIGLRAPRIYAADLAAGLLLLEDLGDHTFTRLLADGADETALYRQAIDLLAHLHGHGEATAIDLPPYDAELACGEADLWLDWYLPARLQRPVTAAARSEFRRLWRATLNALPPCAPVLVLRDYHIDNLMVRHGKCAALDYQDAVLGSPAYDLASLLEDARRDVSAPLAADMLRQYAAQNPAIDAATLRQHYVVWAAQRHCKVAGIFTRLWLRDGKPAYLQHLPRVLKLLQRHLHEPILAPLRDWLSEHLGAESTAIEHRPFTAPPAALARHCGGS